MNGIDTVIAGTAFEIVARSFSSGDGSDRNSFRLKNLTRSEAMEFLRVWQQRCTINGLERVRLLIASDSHDEFPREFRADPDHSITYYRNNNEHGLVYIETKVESDEQGLKNLFTLRDVNFLDGSFDEDGEFYVPEEMVRQALRVAGSIDPNGNQLLRDRLFEVLRELNSGGITVPVRKFAGFVIAATREMASNPHPYSPDETNALVGRCLLHLDMFPDEHWRESPSRLSRRLSLNLLRSELAASLSSDLDAEKTAQDCLRTKYVDEGGELYEPDKQAYWREECSKYCLSPTRDQRERIPYRIFEQAFRKDVKGLPLGQLVAEEIVGHSPGRKSEFDSLSVELGLNSRSSDDAIKFLESEPVDTGVLPLKDLLSKQTRRRIEKLASPAIERVRNPLIKLAQVAKAFRESLDLEEGEFRIEMRAGAGTTEQHTPTLGLFAFLYGGPLAEISENLADGLGSITFEIDSRLTNQSEVPPLKGDLDPEAEYSEVGSSEEDEGTVWLPVPLEFVLRDMRDGSEVDSELSIEWLPEDLTYLALFWISVCGEDRGEVPAEIFAPSNRNGEQWINEVAHRTLPFANGRGRQFGEELQKHPIINRLLGLRTKFRAEASREGLSPALLNDVFDEWSLLLADARKAFVPDGDIPAGMIEFMNADCVQGFDGENTLMLQSHPLKLRWIASYLSKSAQLASDAIEGTLRLNEQNENLYLNWIQGLSPHQQPPIHTSLEGHILFADGERGWTEKFQKHASSGGTASGDRIHTSLVSEIVRQITGYLHAHPYKADGLRILVVTGGASALPADIVQGVRLGEFKNLSITIELVAPRNCWDEAARQFELVDTDNRLTGDGTLFPPVQLNLHDLEKVRENANMELGNLICDLAIVPQFIDDNISTDRKSENEPALLGSFSPLLDTPTYIASGGGAASLSVSLRPKMPDAALSGWSTLSVRHDLRSPVTPDRPEATDYIDIRINFHNTARFFGVLHKCSQWVITVERHITREQIEKLETRPEVLSLREGVGPGGMFTLIVSSNTGQKFIIDRLTRKLKRVASLIGKSELVEKQTKHLAQIIYDEARQIAPRLTLEALGISRVTEEVLGLSVARQVANWQMPTSVEDGFVAWISLDEHPEWFSSANSMRADMIRLTVNLGADGLSVDLLVIESKLRRAGYDAHGAEQVRMTLQMFDSVFPINGRPDRVDGELWRDTLLSAVDTVSKQAFLVPQEGSEDAAPRRSRVSEEIRTLFRAGDFAKVNLAGLYSICEYSRSRSLTAEVYEVDPRVLIVQTGGGVLLDRSPEFMASNLNSNRKENEGDNIVKPAITNNFANINDQAETSKGHSTAQNAFNDRFGEPDHADENPRSANVALTKGRTSDHLGRGELERRYQIILDTFGQYGINVSKTATDVEYAVEGPASILFRVRPGKGVPPSKLAAQHDSLKLALELDASQDIRFDIDKGYVTIDVPKLDKDRYFVSAPELWSVWKRPDAGLKVPLGEDRFGGVVEIDFTSSNSPHLLIGGTTGSGKSEALNTILAGIVRHYSPDEVRLQLIDPKGTELEHLSGSEHLDGEIGWDEEDAIEILTRAVDEMQARYVKFKNSKVRSLLDYNETVTFEERIPRWVIVLDEYADLTSDPETKRIIEAHLRRLAQKSRAAGIHVIIATQKPDASVISTNLRSNLPAQLALRVKSSTESRVIMDEGGAESLTGKGDAFFKESGILTRVQCAKVDT